MSPGMWDSAGGRTFVLEEDQSTLKRHPCLIPPVQGPFTYEALPPEEIKFVPLKQTQEFNAKDLMQVGRW